MYGLLPELNFFVDELWQKSIDSKFSELYRIPSSVVRSSCRLFETNIERYGIDYLQKLSRWQLDQTEREDLLLQSSRLQAGDWSLQPIADLKAVLAYASKHRDNLAERSAANAALAKLNGIDTPSAAQVRKILNATLKNRYDEKLSNSGGGSYSVPISVANHKVSLIFDFGGFSRGFKYEILLPIPSARGSRKHLSTSYEGLIGFPASAWDLLRTDRLEDDMALFFENLAVLIQFVTISQVPSRFVTPKETA